MDNNYKHKCHCRKRYEADEIISCLNQLNIVAPNKIHQTEYICVKCALAWPNNVQTLCDQVKKKKQIIHEFKKKTVSAYIIIREVDENINQ